MNVSDISEISEIPLPSINTDILISNNSNSNSLNANPVISYNMISNNNISYDLVSPDTIIANIATSSNCLHPESMITNTTTSSYLVNTESIISNDTISSELLYTETMISINDVSPNLLNTEGIISEDITFSGASINKANELNSLNKNCNHAVISSIIENTFNLSPVISSELIDCHKNTVCHLLNESELFTVNIKKISKHWFLYEEHEKFESYKNNFLKGCKWSPNGTYLLTCSNDNILRNFEPKMMDSLEINLDLISKAQEGDIVYDFDWYPFVLDAATCCYLTTSRDQPIHLRNALDGSLQSSYRSFNQMDELAPVTSVTFSPDGKQIYCGLEKMIRVFEVSRPGREYQSRPTYVNTHGQHGIISCISFNPVMPTMYAAGSYSKSVALYCEPLGNITCMLLGQSGGVTHIKFSQDGNRLYSGGRKDSEILCWDVRNLGRILYVMKREVKTNQRFYFNFDSSGRYLISGNQDGKVKIWDTRGTVLSSNSEPILQPIYTFTAHDDAVTSISMHPSDNYLASGCGQRHFPLIQFSDSDDEMEKDDDDDYYKLSLEENSIKIWKLNFD